MLLPTVAFAATWLAGSPNFETGDKSTKARQAWLGCSRGGTRAHVATFGPGAGTPRHYARTAEKSPRNSMRTNRGTSTTNPPCMMQQQQQQPQAGHSASSPCICPAIASATGRSSHPPRAHQPGASLGAATPFFWLLKDSGRHTGLALRVPARLPFDRFRTPIRTARSGPCRRNNLLSARLSLLATPSALL